MLRSLAPRVETLLQNLVIEFMDLTALESGWVSQAWITDHTTRPATITPTVPTIARVTVVVARKKWKEKAASKATTLELGPGTHWSVPFYDNQSREYLRPHEQCIRETM